MDLNGDGNLDKVEMMDFCQTCVLHTILHTLDYAVAHTRLCCGTLDYAVAQCVRVTTTFMLALIFVFWRIRTCSAVQCSSPTP